MFVTDYLRDHKAFYMRLNDGHETVAATDLLVPRIGEMIGGSQREERLDVLERQIAHFDVPADTLSGTSTCGAGGRRRTAASDSGFERMLMWITGMKNIRDVLPFPRTPGNAGH